MTLTADRRLLARFDGTAGQWRLNQGSYHVVVGKGANDLHLSADTKLAEALFGTRPSRVTGHPSPRLRSSRADARGFVGRRLAQVPTHPWSPAVVGLLATVLIPVPRSPQPSSAPYDTA